MSLNRWEKAAVDNEYHYHKGSSTAPLVTTCENHLSTRFRAGKEHINIRLRALDDDAMASTTTVLLLYARRGSNNWSVYPTVHTEPTSKHIHVLTTNGDNPIALTPGAYVFKTRRLLVNGSLSKSSAISAMVTVI